MKHPELRRTTALAAALSTAAAALSTAVVGLGLAVGTPTGARAATTAPAPTDGLIADYAFDQTTGATVANQAGGAGATGDATVQNAADSLWTGDALSFTGGAKSSSTADWVRLPDNILAGKDSATITTEVRIDATMKSSYNFLWNVGNDSTTSYYFASVKDDSRTAITTSSNGGEINARASSGLSADDWHSLTSVIDGDAMTISYYVDGVLQQTAPTTLTPADITDQSLDAIGRSPWPDPFFEGEVSTFRVYDRALDAGEVEAVSDADAQLHSGAISAEAQTVLDGIGSQDLTDTTQKLPDGGGAVTWSSDNPAITIDDDGVTAHVTQPSAAATTTSLTATVDFRGVQVSKQVEVTIEPKPDADDAYGYLMVHFVEDSAGYAEKVYLDISRGDDPDHWDTLNGGQPVLASDLGTTGVRDPYLTYNPETRTYYIIATDLRVHGGDDAGWTAWQRNYSTEMDVWSSKDLVNWSDVRQFDVALDSNGAKVANLGMMWAPEATWVPDYYREGKGAFVVYWASKLYDDSDTTQSSSSAYARVMWGATTDFTQDTWTYGGVFIDDGGATIDTDIIQNAGTTYRLTKDEDNGKGIYLQSTTAAQWWLPSATWTTLQTEVGSVWSSSVEGPLMFKDNHSAKWYAWVVMIPSGYAPMVTTDLDSGFGKLTDDYEHDPRPQHGSVLNLTAGEYDAIRSADAKSVTTDDLGTVTVAHGSSDTAITAALPQAGVTEYNDRGTTTLPVDWDLSSVHTGTAGSYRVTGTVESLGANDNSWVGAGGSTAYDAAGKVPTSTTALTVHATVTVTAAPMVASRLVLKASPSRLRLNRHHRARFVVSGKVSASVATTGKVVVTVAGKAHRVKLSSTGGYRLAVTVTKAKRYAVTARYPGSARVAPSATKTVHVLVRKRR